MSRSYFASSEQGHRPVDRRLIRLAEISESTERRVEVFAIPKVERIESTSRQVKQLIALHVTHGTQFATPAPAFSKQARDAVTPSVSEAREPYSDQIQFRKIAHEYLRIVASRETHTDTTPVRTQLA